MEDMPIRKKNTRPPLIQLRDLLTIGLRHRRLVTLSFVGLTAGVFLSLFLLPPRYKAATKILVKREHPQLGELEVQNFLGSSVEGAGLGSPAPLLGQHTREVALELAGVSPEAYREMLAAGCLFENDGEIGKADVSPKRGAVSSKG